jgi:HSP20 family molecular chaperone IbpA
MAFYSRSPVDFAPLFRLLDDYDDHHSTRSSGASHRRNNKSTAPSFVPKFDVREANNSYLLDGELPGVQQKDVEIEFTDPYTLVIKGRAEYNYNGNSEQGELNQDDSASSKSKSHQPTVEDADEETTGNGNDFAVTTTSVTPKESSTSSEEGLSNIAKSKGVQKPSFIYWVSERSVGEFHRTFTFPTRVNQDAVKAGLKNGILSIVVPKEPVHTAKKIRIE